MKFTVVALLTLLTFVHAYNFEKPKNGTELEQTLRSELDDIWVVQWFQDKAAPEEEGAEMSDEDKKFNEKNADIQMTIQKQCPTLNKEYKFLSVDMDPEKQRDAENDDRDTDFKELMIKLKIDGAEY